MCYPIASSVFGTLLSAFAFTVISPLGLTNLLSRTTSCDIISKSCCKTEGHYNLNICNNTVCKIWHWLCTPIADSWIQQSHNCMDSKHSFTSRKDRNIEIFSKCLILNNYRRKPMIHSITLTIYVGFWWWITICWKHKPSATQKTFACTGHQGS